MSRAWTTGVVAVAALLGACSKNDGAPPTAQVGASDAGAPDVAAPAPATPVKVMVVNMFSLEGDPFVRNLALTKDTPVTGLPAGSPAVHCNADDVCEVTIGMGYANAASSMTALLYRGGFDLTHAYFIVAGIAGVDPKSGTLGSAAWARNVVDVGYANEIDAREMPSGWAYGYFGIGAKTPNDVPANDYRGATFHVNDDLAAQAFSLSRGVTLVDAPLAAQTRAKYTYAPANQPPAVIACDVVSSDTWFSGTTLTQRARDWTELLTHGAGTFCMSAQEDNATLEVLQRGAAAGKVDMNRVAVLRSGSDFSAPYDGETDADGLVNSLGQGGLVPATANLFNAANPLIQAIVKDWSTWQVGVPTP